VLKAPSRRYLELAVPATYGHSCVKRFNSGTADPKVEQPFVCDPRAGDVAAQAFEFPAPMRTTAHSGMQTEAVHFGAHGRRGFLVPADHGAQAHHRLSSTRPQRSRYG
jgi:hypothetical protein